MNPQVIGLAKLAELALQTNPFVKHIGLVHEHGFYLAENEVNKLRNSIRDQKEFKEIYEGFEVLINKYTTSKATHYHRNEEQSRGYFQYLPESELAKIHQFKQGTQLDIILRDKDRCEEYEDKPVQEVANNIPYKSIQSILVSEKLLRKLKKDFHLTEDYIESTVENIFSHEIQTLGESSDIIIEQNSEGTELIYQRKDTLRILDEINFA